VATTVSVVESGVVRVVAVVPQRILLAALLAHAPLSDELAARTVRRHGALADTVMVSDPGLSTKPAVMSAAVRLPLDGVRENCVPCCTVRSRVA
jgi:hypothetical protein